MVRCLLTSLVILGATGSLSADSRLDPVAGKSPADIKEEAALTEMILAQKYRDFEAALLRLAQRLERSTKPEDREKGLMVRRALETAGKVGISTRFSKLIGLLNDPRAGNLDEVKDAIHHGEQLVADLQEVLAQLLSDRDLDRNRRRVKRLEELIRMLNAAIRDQKMVRIHTESGKRTQDELVQGQDRVTQQTDALARELEKDSETGLERLPGRELVRGANDDQRAAGRNIGEKKYDAASSNQTAAIDKLVRVRDALEQLLRQLRQNEIKQLLANLQLRCERMLQMQKEVNEGTVKLDRAVHANEDEKPARADEQKSLLLADQEGVIVKEADRALALIREEGSAIVFAEVFVQLREDMETVQRRLNKADAGALTQRIEQDISATLQEIIEALKKAQQPPQPGPGGGPPGPPKPPSKEPRLVDLVAELKMIRSMQLRVNDRTKAYSKLYPGEQADAPNILRELKDLADRQMKILRVTQSTDAREKTGD